LGLYIYNKTYFTQNKLNFGLVNVFQPFTNEWLHFALQIGWKENSNNDFYIRTNTGKKFDKVKSLNEIVLNYIYKCDSNNNLGVEVTFDVFRSNYPTLIKRESMPRLSGIINLNLHLILASN